MKPTAQNDHIAQPELWDERVRDYEADGEPFTRHYAEAALALAGGVAPGQRVLDVAAGTGPLSSE